jgi:hypothetical protein
VRGGAGVRSASSTGPRRRVHFSLSITPRPVALRSNSPEVVPVVRSAGARASNGRSPKRSDGKERGFDTRTSESAGVRCAVPSAPCVWAGARAIASVGCVGSDSVYSFEIPVCGGHVSGTHRTRLETRTKESSMCASHWELLIIERIELNPRAQRK